MKHLCWFIGAYFFTFSKEFSENGCIDVVLKTLENTLENTLEKTLEKTLERRLFETFVKGHTEELLDEKYDFELGISQYFIPILQYYHLSEILLRIPSYYFNFPFIPKNIFKDNSLYEYFKNHFKPSQTIKHWDSSKKTFHESILRKDSFVFVIETCHVNVYAHFKNRYLKIN